jgi:hypothetical protein
MSRPRTVSKKAILEAHAKCKTVVDMAVRLGVCEMTVRNYLKKYGLSVRSTEEKRQRSVEIFNAYKGRITLPELANQFGIKEHEARYHLHKAMIQLYSSDNPPKWPMPKIIAHIKILHLLNRLPKLADSRRTGRISEKTGLSEESIALYLNQLAKRR